MCSPQGGQAQLRGPGTRPCGEAKHRTQAVETGRQARGGVGDGRGAGQGVVIDAPTLLASLGVPPTPTPSANGISQDCVLVSFSSEHSYVQTVEAMCLCDDCISKAGGAALAVNVPPLRYLDIRLVNY